jgi:D-sedoheptulose 7-phosphate isomerase
MKETIKKEFLEHQKVASLLPNLTEDVASSAQICIDCLRKGGKILLFGNGGSAADAQHIAAELVGSFKAHRNGLAAIALTTDSSSLTSISNDFGFEHVFDRQVQALAKEGDVAIGISTSGKSDNVINALKLASKLKCHTIGLSGKSGGEMNKICDFNIIAPSSNTPRIQELHIVIGHTICLIIDQKFKN